MTQFLASLFSSGKGNSSSEEWLIPDEIEPCLSHQPLDNISTENTPPVVTGEEDPFVDCLEDSDLKNDHILRRIVETVLIGDPDRIHYLLENPDRAEEEDREFYKTQLLKVKRMVLGKVIPTAADIWDATRGKSTTEIALLTAKKIAMMPIGFLLKRTRDTFCAANFVLKCMMHPDVATRNMVRLVTNPTHPLEAVESFEHFVPPPPPPPKPLEDAALTHLLNTVGEEIRTQVDAIYAEGHRIIPQTHPRGLQVASETEPARPVGSAEPTVLVKTAEEKATELLVNNIVHFASITTFNKFVFRDNPDSSLDFFKQFSHTKSKADIEADDAEIATLLSKAATDKERAKIRKPIGNFLRNYYLSVDESRATFNPLEAYALYIAESNIIYYYIARIVLPIIQWFISLVLKSQENADTGINHLKDEITKYFEKHPEAIKNEFLNFVNETSDYFASLHKFHMEYDAMQLAIEEKRYDKRNCDYPGYSLSNYVAKRLEENLKGIIELKIKTPTPADSKKFLADKFNDFITQIIHIQTGIPIIGGLVDRLLKIIIEPIAKNLNITSTALNNLYTENSFNPNLTYSIKEMLIKEIDKFAEKQCSGDQPLARGSELKTKFAEDSLNQIEQGKVNELIINLLKFLPLERVEPSKLREALGALAGPVTPIGRLIVDVLRKYLGIDANKEFVKKLSDATIEIVAGLIETYKKEDSRSQIWNQILTQANTLFDGRSISRKKTPDDLIAINNKLKESIDRLVEITLKQKLNELPPIEEQKKIAHLINNTKYPIEIFTQRLQQLHEQIQAHSNPNQAINDIEQCGFQIIIGLDEFSTTLMNALKNALSCEKKDKGKKVSLLDQKTRDELKLSIDAIRQQIHLISQEYARLKKAIATIRHHQAFKNAAISPFLPVDPLENEDLLHEHIYEQTNAEDIYLGLPKAKFDASTKRLQQDISREQTRLSEQEKSHIKTFVDNQSDLIIQIDKKNQELKQQKTHLFWLNKVLGDIGTLQEHNALLVNRPKEEALITLKSNLTSMKNRFDNILHPSSEENSLELRIGNLNNEFTAFKANLRDYQSLLSGTEKHDLETACQNVENIITQLNLAAAEPSQVNRNVRMLTKINQLKMKYQTSFSTAITKLHHALNKFPSSDISNQKAIETLLVTIEKASKELRKPNSLLQIPECFYADLERYIQICTLANSEGEHSNNTSVISGCKQYITEEIQRNTTQLERQKQEKQRLQTELQEQLIAIEEITEEWLNKDWQNIQEINQRLANQNREIQKIEQAMYIPEVAPLLKNKYILPELTDEYLPGLLDVRVEDVPQMTFDVAITEFKNLLLKAKEPLINLIVDPLHADELLTRGVLARVAQSK